MAAAMLLTIMPLMAEVTFRFSANSVDAASDKAAMERNVSALLTEINRAGLEDRDLDLSGVPIEEGAKERLNALWSSIHLTCDKNLYQRKCLYDMQGVQVRGILVSVEPVDDTYNQSLSRELTVSLSNKGTITGVRLSMESQEDVDKIMGEGEAVTDLRQRRELLKFVEDFRCYYNERNLDALEKIFSDNALIITGSVIRQGRKGTEAAILENARVKYKVQSKKEYIANLAKVFKNNQRLEVSFDDIMVTRNGSKAHLYGVTLRQKWVSSSYSDDGWLFLYWDLSDPDEPKILVRTWQEDEIVSQQGIFNIHDFFVE